MATSSDQVHGQEYVDFDEYIDIQLRKTGSTIKTTDVMTAVVGILTLVTLYLLLFVICDHWIVPGGFGPVSRGIMLAIVGSAACAWLVLKVIVPWRRRVSVLYAASTIEKASPALKSSLLNLVDMSRSGHEVSPEIYQSIERRAALALTHVDVNESVDRRSLLRLSNALLAVVVLFCLYWIFSPKNPATSLWRAIVPSADTGVATRTEIFNVHPGDKDVLARSQLEVSADIRGELPAQTFLYFTTADRKFVDERVEMRLENESTRKFRCVLTGDNGGGILQNMTYRIVAGDAATPEYKIRVIQPPAATIESIRLEAPEYTRREPVLQTTGAIDALEGTQVTLKARANMPVRSPASLQFFDDETASKRAEEIPIRVTDGTRLEVNWKLEIRSDGTYPHYYRIFCTSTAGESDPSPSLYSLDIRRDQSPEITLVDPKTDLELPANAIVPLVIEARDPDFALRYIDLNIEKDGSPVNGPTIYSDRNDQQFKTTYKWSLRDYHFRPKETVTYWLQAKDNRQPIANATRTPKLRIRIIDPIPEDQVKKNLELAQQRQKEEQNKSDAERPPQDKPEENAAEDPNQKQQNRADRPKDKKQLAARQQQKDPAKNGDPNEKPDDQNGDGQNGQGQNAPGQSGGAQPQDKGKQDPKAEKDKGSAADGDNKQQPLNPDDPADDPKALQKLLDQERREQEKKNKENSSGAGQGDQGSEGQKNSAVQDQQQKNDAGSQPKSSPDGKNSEKISGQGAQKENESPSGSQAEQQQQAGQKRGHEKDQAPGQSETKKQAPASDDKKSDSTGSKPQGEKSSGSNKEGDKQDSQRDSQAGQQKGPKNGSAAGSPESKNNQDKTEGRPENKSQDDKTQGDKSQTDKTQGDKTQGEKQPGAANDEQRKNSNSQPEPGAKQDSKQEQSRSDSARTSDDKDHRSNQGADASKDKNGEQKKSDGQRQNGNESGGDKPNDPNDKNGDAQSKSSTNDGQSASPKNGSDAGQKGQTNKEGEKKETGTKEAGAKETGAKENGQKDSADKERARGDASQKGNANQKGNADQKGDAARKSERSQAKPDGVKSDAKNSEQDSKEQGDKTNAAPSDKATPQQARPHDRPHKKTVDEQPPSANSKLAEEQPRTMRDKKIPPRTGAGESDVAPPSGAPEAGSRKDAAAEQGSNEGRAEQKSGGQKAPSQKETDGQEKPGSKEQAGAKQKADGGKNGEKSDDAQGGQQEQGKDGSGKQGAGAEGKGQGQQGKGQAGKGQDGAGKSGTEGKSNTPGSKGGKTGAGTGDAKSGNNGGGFNNGNGTGQGEALEDTSKEANLDYAKKATDLVLKRLEGQLKRGQIDEKVQEELGWTKDQIRRFVERMRRQAQTAEDPTSPAAEARRLQFEETLKSLNLRSPAKSRTSRAVPRSNDFEMESKRSIPPPEYRDLYNAFTKSLAKPVAPPADDKK
jgi:collagen type III alpha